MSTERDEFASRKYPIQEDIPLQFRHWRAERVGWCVIVLLAFAALLGVFANGPLSSARIEAADGAISLLYQRFERRSAPTRLVVKAKAGADGLVHVSLDSSFLQRFTLEGIQPNPVSSRGYGQGGLRVAFMPDEQGGVQAYFNARPDGIGLSRTKVIVNGTPLVIAQFLYP